MAPHHQPTQEELDQKIKEAEEALVKKGKESAEGETSEEETENEDNQVDISPDEEGKEEETVSEEGKGEEIEPSHELKERLKVEVKEKDKKLSASAREAQKLYAKNRVINKALIEAEETPEPTAEELVAEFPDWDVMSETERALAKETVISRNWRATIARAKEQTTKIEKWNDSVDEFVGDPQTLIDNSDLEGKTDEFTAFAKEEANNSVPFKVLIGAFLHEQSKNKKVNKGRMFETGSGGPNDKPTPKTGKISLEESRILRETDYDKWKEYVEADKIDFNL